MRHTHSFPHRAFAFRWGALLMALLLGGLSGTSWAQDTAPGKTILVPINGTVRLQMTTKKPIRTVSNPKENVLNIRTVLGDPTTVLLVGQQPDITRLEMIDVDGNTEVYEVIIQPDVEYLKKQLQRTVPEGNIDAIPVSRNQVALVGQLNRPEDAALAAGVAQAAGFTPLNGLRVGGVQQVQLDVVIATVSRTEFRRMAFNFLTNAENYFLGSTVGQAVVNPLTVGVGGILSNGPGGLLGTPGAPNGAPTNALFGIIHENWGFLGFLQALRDENVLKLLAEPRLVTLSGQPASFLVGGEQAIPVPAGLGQVGVQFEEFGTRLNFLPIVMGNGKIHLEVEPEVSNLDPSAGTAIEGTVVPGRVTNRVHTTVELESGQTFVIGGLIQRTIVGNTTKLPVLGELPYVSALFNSKSFQEVEMEVVVMVTPYLVDAQSCGQKAKVLPGQETRSPDDFELFLESILEAPRGQRTVCHGRGYVPAFKHSPSYRVYPCAGSGAGCTSGCANGSCGLEGYVVEQPMDAGIRVQTAPAGHGNLSMTPAAPQPMSVSGSDSSLRMVPQHMGSTTPGLQRLPASVSSGTEDFKTMAPMPGSDEATGGAGSKPHGLPTAVLPNRE
jgi:pilus assembly protein CpaC